MAISIRNLKIRQQIL